MNANSKPRGRFVRVLFATGRVLKWTLIVVVVLLLVIRASLPWAVPFAAKKVGEPMGLDIALNDFTLSVFGGEVSLSGLEVRPAADQGMATDAPIVALRRLAVDLGMRDLFDGVVRVRSVDVAGLEVAVERRADGTIVLPKAMTDRSEEAADEPAEEEVVAEPAPAVEEPPKPYDFTLPVRVDRVSVSNLRARVKDGAVNPALDRTLELDLDLAALGVPGQPFSLDLRASIPALLESFRIAIDGAVEGPRADARVAVDMTGLALAPLAPYLAPAGVKPIASQLDFSVAIEAAADAQGRPARELGASLAVNGLALRADLVEAFGLDRFEVKVSRVSDAAIDVGNVVLAGLRGAARKQEDGTLRVAGFELGAPPAMEAAPGAAAPTIAETAEKAPTDSTPAAPAPVVSVAAVDVSDLRFAFTDASLSPPLSVEPRVLSLTTRDLVLDEKAAERPIAVAIAVALPGILERLDIAASSAVEGGARTFAVELDGQGVNAVALAPWIEPSGIEPTLKNGELALKTSGRIEPPMGAPTRIAASLTGVRLSEGVELFGLDGLVIESVSLSDSEIEITTVTLDNPRVVVKREADGSLRVPALRIPAVAKAAAPSGAAANDGSTASSNDTAPAPTTDPNDSEATTAKPAPTIVLGKFAWKNAALRFEDEAISEPRAFTLKDVDLAVEGVRVTGAGIEQPVALRLNAAVDGLLRSLAIEARASAKTAGDDLDASANLSLVLSGLNYDAIAPYAAGAPIDPTFDAADFRLTAVALAKKQSGVLTAGVEVTDLALTDGASTLFGLDRLAVDDAVVGPDAVDVGEVVVSGVRLGAERLEDGGLIACGVALVPPPANPAATAGAPIRPTASADSSADTAVVDTPAAESGSAPIRLRKIVVDGVEVAWKDQAVTPVVDTTLTLLLGVEGLELSESPPPAAFGVGLRLKDAIDRFGLEGTFVPNPDDLRVAANLSIAGLRPDAVLGYLAAAPPITLKDGRIALALDARLAKANEGGQDASLAVKSFSYRDGEQDPFLAFEEFAVVAPRIDAATGNFRVAKLALAGFATRAEKTEEGGMNLLGIALPPPAATVDSAAAPLPTSESTADPTAEAPPAPAASEVAPVAAQKALALLAQVDELDLEIANVTFVDRTKTQPPIVAALRLASEGPIVIDSNERSDAAPPIRLALTANVEPLGAALGLKLHAEPLASEPLVRADFAVSGIDANKLAELVPGVFDTSEPPRVTDGVLGGSVEGRLIFRRRGPLDFDIAHGFGALVQVKDVAFRERPDGEILAGLDGLRASVKRMAPATGDVHLDQIEISTPRLSVVKRAAYTEVAGLRFPNPTPAPAGDANAPIAESTPAPVAPAEPVAATEPAEPGKAATPAPELRVDELLVHGIAVEVRDETANPPFVLPLEKLEIEVRNATTRALVQPIPIRFNVQLGSGLVDLPVRKAPEPLVPSVGNLAGGVADLGSGAITAGIDVGKGALDVGKGALGAGAEGVGKIGDALGGLVFGKKKEETSGVAPETATPDPAAPSAAESEATTDAATAPAETSESAPEPAPELEKRLLFEEIELKGQLALVPTPRGNVDIRISAFELLGVKGIAEAAGVTISEGLLDLGVQTRFLGADGLNITTVTSFENLSLTEPANGPISRYLQLPAPLDVVVFALRDEESVMRIPLRVAIKPDDISLTGILGSVTATLAEMIARAIAHSPLRAVGAVGDIGGAAMGAVGLENVGLETVGLDKGLSAIGLGGSDAPKAEDRTELAFSVADAVVGPANREKIALIASTMLEEPETKVVLSHRLVRQDVERAKVLVNPARGAIDEIVVGLKHRRAELVARRDALTAELRVRFVYGDPWSAREPAERLRDVQDELGRIEEALDDLYDLTAPEAERRKDTRARAGSLAVAAQRLAEIRRALIAAGGAELADRIEVQAPRFLIDAADSGAVIADLKRSRRP